MNTLTNLLMGKKIFPYLLHSIYYGIFFFWSFPLLGQTPPEDLQPGITYVDDSTVHLLLFAPNKTQVSVLGDFNNWDTSQAFPMNRSTDGNTYWITLDKPGTQKALCLSIPY